jgi:hypothetical protein
MAKNRILPEWLTRLHYPDPNASLQLYNTNNDTMYTASHSADIKKLVLAYLLDYTRAGTMHYF